MIEPTQSARRETAHRTMRLLAGWDLTRGEAARLLGLPDSGEMHAASPPSEQADTPDDGLAHRRAAYLLRIEESLHTYFPRNPEMRRLWVKRRNTRLGGRTPIAVMLEEGEPGIIAVLAQLDCTFAWDLTGSKSEYGAR